MAKEKKKYVPFNIPDDSISAEILLRDPEISSKLGTGEIEDWGGGTRVTDQFGDEYVITGSRAKRVGYGL